MEFIHRPFQSGETIAAIATPPGEGGIAIIRISGNEAIQVADRIFSGRVHDYASHTAHFGYVLDEKGKKIDEALLLLMLGRRSYTGEDTVELQCHGGMIAAKRVLGAVLRAGARLAAPGEFTLKAFMNGRLDLTQAEAVQALIGAKNAAAFDIAGQHLEGKLSQKIKDLQAKLTSAAAILEAWIDFPEEGIEFCSLPELATDFKAILAEIRTLLDTFENGKKITSGISCCIIGAPNVGKSSLLNALLDQERAIVTPIAGTTRDLIQEDFHLGNLHFQLTDTAGLRMTEEIVEKEGIRRSREAMKKADLVFFVLDAHEGIEEDLFSELSPEKTLVIWNKIDLPHPTLPTVPFPHVVKISIKEKVGLQELLQKMEEIVSLANVPSKEEVILTNIRHKEALESAEKACESVVVGLVDGASPEFLTSDVRSALGELGRIIGTNIGEDILSSIFSQFCIGK